MSKDAKRKARVELLQAQAEFERAETQRERASEIRRKSFERARGAGMTLREIGEIVGLHHTRVSQIIRGE